MACIKIFLRCSRHWPRILHVHSYASGRPYEKNNCRVFLSTKPRDLASSKRNCRSCLTYLHHHPLRLDPPRHNFIPTAPACRRVKRHTQPRATCPCVSLSTTHLIHCVASSTAERRPLKKPALTAAHRPSSTPKSTPTLSRLFVLLEIGRASCRERV